MRDQFRFYNILPLLLILLHNLEHRLRPGDVPIVSMSVALAALDPVELVERVTDATDSVKENLAGTHWGADVAHVFHALIG